MTRKMKAILVLFFAAEIVNSAKVGVLKGRIADLETQRDIYASRAQNWLDRAVEDEEVIDSLQIRLDETADRKIELTEAGTFFCTAYCTEQYEHICGEGHGITASGQPIQAGVTEGRWSGVAWRLNVSALPAGNAPLKAWRLELELSDGTRHAHYATMQVRSAGAGAPP